MLVRLVLLAFLIFPTACSYYSGPGVPDIYDTSGAAGSEGSSEPSGDGVVHLEN